MMQQARRQSRSLRGLILRLRRFPDFRADMMPFRLFLFRRVVLALLGACALAACDGLTGPSETWTCNVTLRADNLTGTGSGTGSTQEEALHAARSNACSQLGLNVNRRSRCERGENPGGFFSWSFRHSCEN